MARSQTTEIIARGCIVHRAQLLVCRNLKGGYAYLPGGHVEFGESAPVALARELVEECGLSSEVGKLLLVSEHAFEAGGKPHHEINLVFHVEQLDGVELGSGAETPTVESREPEIGFEWIDLAAITDEDLRPAEIKAWLASGGQTDPEAGCFLQGIASPADS